MLDLLFIWAGLLAALVICAVGRPGQGGALTLAYFLGASLLHVPGVLPFAITGAGPEETRLGFEATLLGLAAFVASAILARHLDPHRAAEAAPSAAPGHSAAFERLGWRALALGAGAYFTLIPLSFNVPSLTSLVSAFATLVIVGLWLVLYGAARSVDRGTTVATLAALPLLPTATLVSGGFLGYGIYWILSVVAFLFVISPRRRWFYLSAPIAAFLGLSLFVTYMGHREEIRELVWQRQAGLFDRLERVSRLVTDFELLDLSSHQHAFALDRRLNQNHIAGIAVMRHEAGRADLAYGATVPLWALIPRAVWPEKPWVGGGGNVVSDFTGIRYSEGTSVGAGQVLEFYVNFGRTGVVLGFFALGFVLMRLDRGIMRALAANDTRGLLLRGMPGLTLLQPGGNLLEIVVACVGAYLAARVILWVGLFGINLPMRRSGETA